MDPIDIIWLVPEDCKPFTNTTLFKFLFDAEFEITESNPEFIPNGLVDTRRLYCGSLPDLDGEYKIDVCFEHIMTFEPHQLLVE